MNEPLLQVKNLCTSFNVDSGEVRAVNGISFNLDKGKVLGIVGESGSGKSVTAYSIMRILVEPGRITGGEILFNGQDVRRMTDAEKRRLRGGDVSMIFQDPMTSLNPIMTVEEQITAMVQLHLNLKGEAARERAIEMLRLVGIRPERAKDFPHQFSGGMRQRVVIAIALACRPQLIIADEPTTAIVVTIQAQVLELIKKLQQSEKTSMLLITHDLGIVAETCDTVAIMYAGHLVEYADIKSLYTNPKHPYTQGLFNAVPTLESPLGSRLAVIPGLPPDPTNLPKGCSFSPRCPYAQPICHEKACGMREIEPGHFVDCHFPLTPESGNKFLEHPAKEAE